MSSDNEKLQTIFLTVLAIVAGYGLFWLGSAAYGIILDLLRHLLLHL